MANLIEEAEAREAAEKAKRKAAQAAKIEADAAKAKANMEAAVAKARTKPPKTDAEIMGKAPKHMDVDKNPPTTESVKPVKKVKKLAEKAKGRTPASASTTVTPSAKAPEIHVPVKPLAGQGSMADKPVTPSVTKVPDTIKIDPEKHKAFQELQAADRRVQAGRGPGGVERRAVPKVEAPALEAPKVMTPSGAVEATGKAAAAKGDSVAEAMRASLRRGMGAAKHAIPEIDDTVKSAYKSTLSMGRRKAPSLASKAGAALGKGIKWSGTYAGKAAVGIAKSIVRPITSPISEFRAGSAARKEAWAGASKLGKAAQVAKTTAKVGWAAGKTGAGLLRAGGYVIASEMAMEGAAKAGEMKAERELDIEGYKAAGARHGFQVSAAEPSITRMVTGGSPKIKVTQDEGSLKAKRIAGQKKFEERQYNELKSRAGRNVIKG